MLIQFHLLVIVTIACANEVFQTPRLDGRIVGGKLVDIKDFRYQLSLLKNGFHTCGASIIGKLLAVTAAHCVRNTNPSQIRVRAYSSYNDKGGRLIRIKRVFVHPSFNNRIVDFDVAILVLARYVRSNDSVSLPEPNVEPNPGTIATASGWGTLKEQGSLPRQLQAVDVPIVSRENCQKAYGEYAVTNQMICAGYEEGGKDACQGDSGGPLVQNGVLIGIVSWGRGCARSGYPGVYTNVASVRSWIDEAVSFYSS